MADTDTSPTTQPPNTIAVPAAIIRGTPLTTFPEDLYVPPDALKIFLETFEGPLDLLLYLIQRQNLDILDIPIAEITRQYLQYIDLMKELHFDLAAEYLVMAAQLMEIKSQMLLPTYETDDNAVAEDPRTQLVQQLQEYARYKVAAQEMASLPQVGREILPINLEPPPMSEKIIIPQIPLKAVLYAMQGVMSRAALFSSHQVIQEPLSVRERMTQILTRLKQYKTIEFTQMFTLQEGRAGVVVTLLAILELAKESLIEIVYQQKINQIELLRVEGATAELPITVDYD